jgi:hybrid polyketide synthase/nonribosomal peptide synthetase ACE1
VTQGQYANSVSTVKPFYGKVQIATEARPWPQLQQGAVRRASVNSFGFGGSNAHAILEAYEPEIDPERESESSSTAQVYTPLNFSAATASSLRSLLKKYADLLDEQNPINLRDLSWTLNTRRSLHPLRTSVYGITAKEISQRLRSRAEADEKALVEVQSKTLPSKPRVLGVFTGQGAQWARMGAEFLVTSPIAASILDDLERSLSELPDGPDWSLKDEILAEGKSSRASEAAISQPLCTAVQILLVDLLSSAGINFVAVVGHSSGEMGAAYAAGYLSAGDAIRIAYYRGYHLHLAGGPNGETGSMMAVGTSFEDAQELCDLPAFKGHINIAASNSFASVTLSGDTSSINWAKDVFDDEKKFARLLKVDKAYHSHHMMACSDSYRKSLAACKIKVLRPTRSSAAWISSVFGEDAADHRDILKDEYWVQNMVSPVMFSQALEFAAAEKGPFDVVVECGPHPALKGPALQVLQEVLGESPPYTGVLSRGKNDKQAFAEGLGFLWQALGDKVVDFLSFDKFLNGPGVRSPKLLPALPTYAWDHERIFWHESRQSASNRTKSDPTHEILGTKCPDGMEHQLRWRNMIRPKEIPWLSGHQIQGQMVFPAAGYISAALEAVDLATPGEELKMIEIEDFVIGQAIVFNDEYASVETQFTLTNISHGPNSLTADFSFYSVSTKDPMSMGLNASGKISVEIGEHQEDLLPAYPVSDFNMIDVESDRFHDSLSELGFGYTGPFRALESLQRKLGQATGNIRNPASTDPAYDLMVHPATLDSSIQAIILAYCYPHDGRLWSVHLPTSIRKIKVNPSLCNLCAGQEVKLRFRSAITSERSSEIEGDVDIYLEHGQHAMLQLEGLHTKPLANATSSNDSPLFLETVWDVGRPNREASALKRPNLDNQAELSFDIERVAHYYLRKLDIEATKADRENTEWHHKIFFEYIDHTLASVQDRTARFAKKEWIHDTLDEIQSTISKYPDSIDMKLMRAVGEHLLPVIRGETTMLEYMTEDNMLNEFYVSAVGFPEYTNSLAEQVSKFGHRFPHMNVLEIGAGTGGATKHIMKQLDKKFGSYTYTDISTGFFEKAKDVFQEYASKMTFKALNIEKDTSEQGFPDQSYDLVIASLVLHATHEMEVTMRNVRRLLKPGGHLVMLEFVDHEQMRSGLIFGPLPGWWMGYDDGRKLSPCISEKEWDDCLRKTGFAGVDAIVPRQPTLPISLAVLTCQALDDRVSFLRSPLAPSTVEIKLSNLTIIGGATERTKQIIDRCIDLLKPFYSEVTAVVSLADLNSGDVPFMGTILSLTDLDESIFEHMTTEKLNGARQLFQQSKSCLWITQGSRADNPYQNMSVGFGRTINLEMAHLRIQFLDFASADEPMAELIAETLLQFEATDLWDQNGEGQNLLWSVEPEIAYENGNLLVPRLMPSPTRNLRYNSIRRRITKDIDPKSARLSLCWTGQSYEVCDDAASDERVHSKGNIECQVTYSTLQAIKVTNVDYAYLVLGTNVTTQEQIIALTPHRHSIIQAPEKWTIPCHGTTETGLRIMSLVQNYLVALTALDSFSNGDSIVLLEPKEGFASILFALASQKGINLICLTTNDPGKSPYWIPIHPNAPKRDIKAALPRNVSCFFQSSDNERLNATIIKCLPSSCKIRGVEFFMSEDAKIDPHSSAAFIPLALRSAWIHAHHENSSHAIEEQSVISTPNILPQTRRIGEPTVFFWSETPTIPVQTLPVDAKPMFSSDKTYWLVGLTGGLGLSLCEWMVKHGAKYIVITSRNPNIEPRWEEHMRIQGAVIKIHKNDITDRESVRAVYKKICDELPPIAGVAQGAMVLADTMFVDMDIERVQKVLRPKVNGSIYLDEIFSTTKLEFFVFFSSMAYVTGSKGQSIYAAANAYMTSLAARRRKHGLVGSAINIGTILGNGYVTRELTLAQQDYLRRVGNVFMSEQDFHQIFAEAVVAGGESSSDIPEIMTGLRLARMDDEEKMTWFHNPKFSHCVLQPEGNDGKHVVSNQTISVKAQLLTATDADEVRSIVEGKNVPPDKASQLTLCRIISCETEINFANRSLHFDPSHAHRGAWDRFTCGC